MKRTLYLKFVLAYLIFGFSIEFFISITFISMLLIIIISDYQTYIIPELVSKLGNFQNLSNEKDFVYSKYICLNDILKNNLYDIHDTIKEFNLEVKTQSEPIPELNAFGYLILRLNSCIQVVYFYDVNNKINKIRIERITNNLIETIIEFDNDKNLTYDNVELHKILTKNSLLP